MGFGRSWAKERPFPHLTRGFTELFDVEPIQVVPGFHFQIYIVKTANFEQLKVLFSLFYDGFMVYKLLVYVVSN